MIDGDGNAHGTYHWETTYPQQKCAYPKGHQEATVSHAMPSDWSTSFHEYAVEHSATHLAYVYDGVTVMNVSTSDPAPAPEFWPVPFYLILNTAIGGSWPGNATSSTVFPTQHIIDYVRVVVAASGGA